MMDHGTDLKKKSQVMYPEAVQAVIDSTTELAEKYCKTAQSQINSMSSKAAHKRPFSVHLKN